MPRSDTGQLSFFKLSPTEHVVNVASVPQRSPFRYPGGKTWLVPRVRQWLASLKSTPMVLVEPFAGGGIVGLTAAYENLAARVVMVEMDRSVAAVWETILGGDAGWLADRILSYNLTYSNVKTTLAQQDGCGRELAFRTILKNRTYHGGIMAPGASLIRNGENGKGLVSRWYPETLARRILAIGSIRDRITFICGDGIEVMRSYAKRRRAVFFIDPPYTAGGNKGKRAGARLYTHHEIDHPRLFEAAARLAGEVLMTYDDDSEVRSLARDHGFDVKAIAMKNTHHARMNELLIGRSLEWLQ